MKILLTRMLMVMSKFHLLSLLKISSKPVEEEVGVSHGLLLLQVHRENRKNYLPNHISPRNNMIMII